MGVGNIVLAFESRAGAVCYCAEIQRKLEALTEAGLEQEHPIAEAGDAPASNVDAPASSMRDCEGGDIIGNLTDAEESSARFFCMSIRDISRVKMKMGLATVNSRQALEVFEGIDHSSGKRRYSTPVLNMASRVAKAARPGQILAVGDLASEDLESSAFAKEVSCLEMRGLGHYTLKGFGKTAYFLTDVRRRGGRAPALSDHDIDIEHTMYVSRSKASGSDFMLRLSTRARSAASSLKG